IRDFHVTGVQTCALPIWFSAFTGRCGRNSAPSCSRGSGAARQISEFLREESVMASYVDKDELVTQIKVQAMTIMMFTASEPEAELPEPTGMRDLDSFSVVQLILSLEEIYDVQLLEEMPSFTGETFEELADMVAGFVRAKENAGENLAQADT